MIVVSRAPVRLPLGGGGTDLPLYLKENREGYLITSAINKYVYAVVKERNFVNKIKVSYQEVEEVEKIDDIKNDRVRESLKFLKFSDNEKLEISTIADISKESGLGASSAFTISLLNSLLQLKNKIASKKFLAEAAYEIEANRLKNPIGKQDHYASSFGGIIKMKIKSNNIVSVSPLDIEFETIKELEERLLLFLTNVKREPSNQVINKIKEDIERDKSRIEYLDEIKRIAFKIEKCLEKGYIEKLGKYFHYHWNLKRKYSNATTNPYIDEVYEKSLENGALGGKLIGAGGGGCFLFFVSEREKNHLINFLQNFGWRHVDFKFDFDGVKTVYYGE